jgi:hypothetical protein
MSTNGEQAELPVWALPVRHPFRLRVNDYVLVDGRIGRVIRVTESAAVVLVSRPPRQFTTRFDRPVWFRQPPVIVRIAANAEIDILNRKTCPQKRGRKRERRRR